MDAISKWDRMYPVQRRHTQPITYILTYVNCTGQQGILARCATREEAEAVLEADALHVDCPTRYRVIARPSNTILREHIHTAQTDWY